MNGNSLASLCARGDYAGAWDLGQSAIHSFFRLVKSVAPYISCWWITNIVLTGSYWYVCETITYTLYTYTLSYRQYIYVCVSHVQRPHNCQSTEHLIQSFGTSEFYIFCCKICFCCPDPMTWTEQKGHISGLVRNTWCSTDGAEVSTTLQRLSPQADVFWRLQSHHQDLAAQSHGAVGPCERISEVVTIEIHRRPKEIYWMIWKDTVLVGSTMSTI